VGGGGGRAGAAEWRAEAQQLALEQEERVQQPGADLGRGGRERGARDAHACAEDEDRVEEKVERVGGERDLRATRRVHVRLMPSHGGQNAQGHRARVRKGRHSVRAGSRGRGCAVLSLTLSGVTVSSSPRKAAKPMEETRAGTSEIERSRR
jgi:hypothetical protein